MDFFSKKISYFPILIAIILLESCILGGSGTHGSIEAYTLEVSNNGIALSVDEFLINNPEFVDFIDSTSGYGWIHIKVPESNNRYGFRIGGKSNLNLIQAGKVGEEYQYGHELSSFKEREFKKDFKENFLDLINFSEKKEHIVYINPFKLTFNKKVDTVWWPQYFIGIDTVLTFPLPNEFDTLSVDFFNDLLEYYSNSTNNYTYLNQQFNLFRLNEQCTGELTDSIKITRFYRRIGQNFRFTNCFESKVWLSLTDTLNTTNRLNAYSEIRKTRIDNNYKETEVNSKLSEEFWMQEAKH
jgi:hypothetical protein